MMSKKLDLSKINWLQVIGTVIALAGLVFGGGFFYNEVWKSKILTYTVLPNYDLGNGQTFSGLVIENRGREPLTDVQIILSNLEVPIEGLNMPGPHEPAQIVSGGEGQTELSIKMLRLSSGAPPLSIYILTSDALTLEAGKTFFISSKEVTGTPGEKEPGKAYLIILSLIAAFILLLYIGTMLLARRTQKLSEKVEEYVRLRGATTKASPVTVTTEGQLIIKSARYGAQDQYNDVADRVRSAISAGRVEMIVNNDYFGPDPIERVPKKLEVTYFYAGRGYSKTVPENAKLTLP
jgi:hypothetical protein